MNRDVAIDRIKSIEPMLRSRGVAALHLFGSTARGDAGAQSDVDLLCELSPDNTLDLIDFIDLQQSIADQLNAKVDLIERRMLKPRIQRNAEAEMVRVF